jgi:hypothetical protein
MSAEKRRMLVQLKVKRGGGIMIRMPAKGICKWCFNPVWNDDNSKDIDDEPFHIDCAWKVELWQEQKKKSWLEHIRI